MWSMYVTISTILPWTEPFDCWQTEFQGRARWGPTYNGTLNRDMTGHGTHVACVHISRLIDSSKRVKAALPPRAANMVCVSPLTSLLLKLPTIRGTSCGLISPRLYWSSIPVLHRTLTGEFCSHFLLQPVEDLRAFSVSGLDWVLKNAKITKRASVVNYSLGTPQGSPSPSIDKAVKSLTQFGVHVVVSTLSNQFELLLGFPWCVPPEAAAGNDNTPASGSSPAREPSVITVGGSNISDSRRWSSNYGPSINIFAPGENIMSAGIANRWVCEELPCSCWN